MTEKAGTVIRRQELKTHERMGIQSAINARFRAKRLLDASAAGRHFRECDLALQAILKETLKDRGIPQGLAVLEQDAKGAFTGVISWEAPAPAPAPAEDLKELPAPTVYDLELEEVAQ